MSVLSLHGRQARMNELSETEIKARVKVLRVIAARYAELVDPMQSRSSKGSGEAIPLMPETYTATVKEFERLMARMKYDRHSSLVLTAPGEKHSVRRLRWHVLAWYVDATHTVRHVPIQLKKGRKLALMRDEDGQPVITRPVVRWHRVQGAREDLADAGLRWMAESWTARSEPMLPDVVREAA